MILRSPVVLSFALQQSLLLLSAFRPHFSSPFAHPAASRVRFDVDRVIDLDTDPDYPECYFLSLFARPFVDRSRLENFRPARRFASTPSLRPGVSNFNSGREEACRGEKSRETGRNRESITKVAGVGRRGGWNTTRKIPGFEKASMCYISRCIRGRRCT